MVQYLILTHVEQKAVSVDLPASLDREVRRVRGVLSAGEQGRDAHGRGDGDEAEKGWEPSSLELTLNKVNRRGNPLSGPRPFPPRGPGTRPRRRSMPTPDEMKRAAAGGPLKHLKA